jgi:hypothetical protein
MDGIKFGEIPPAAGFFLAAALVATVMHTELVSQFFGDANALPKL